MIGKKGRSPEIYKKKYLVIAGSDAK